AAHWTARITTAGQRRGRITAAPRWIDGSSVGRSPVRGFNVASLMDRLHIEGSAIIPPFFGPIIISAQERAAGSHPCMSGVRQWRRRTKLFFSFADLYCKKIEGRKKDQEPEKITYPSYFSARDILAKRESIRDQVEAVKIHHLVPRSHEVTHERLLPVIAAIDFRDGSELGVRTEDEIDGGTSPLDLTRPAVTSLVGVIALGGFPPLRTHVEQVHEEVVGQRPGSVGEDAQLGLPKICIQHAHPAEQRRHLRSSQGQQVRPIHQ